MPLLSDSEIIEQFTTHKNRFLDGREWWMRNEVREAYAVVEGDDNIPGSSGQWQEGALDRRKEAGVNIYTINKTGPVIDVISGFQVQNRTDAEYLPRQLDQPDHRLVDIINDGVDYIRDATHADHENSRAFRDMLTCGVGCVDALINYDENPFGCAEVSRKAPYMVGWDYAARKKNLVDANWCFAGTLKDKERLLDEINEDLTGEKKLEVLPSGDDRFVEFFDFGGADWQDNLAVTYDYQWRQKEPFWQVKNNLIGSSQIQLLQQSGQLQIIQETFGFDPTKDEVFNVDPKQKKQVEEAWTAIDLPVVATKQKTYRYYRASIVGDIVISKSENYSQKSFSLKFMTGKWSETRQCFYGVVRAMKQPQRLLNEAVTDFAETLSFSPHGGMIVEEDVSDDIEAFKRNWAKMRELAIVKSGALAANKMMPKPTGTLSDAASNMMQFASGAIYETAGITPDFMGNSDMNSNDYDVFGQKVRQGLTVLGIYFDAMTFFITDQGLLFIDCLRVLAENSGGYIIRNISKTVPANGDPNSPPALVQLQKSDISAEYEVVVKESPKTPDERAKERDVLIRIGELLSNAGRDGGAIVPLIIEDMSLSSDKVDEVMEAIKPPPPPQPDPDNQALIQAQTADLQGSAQLKVSQAREKDHGVLKSQQQLEQGPLDTAKLKAEIQQIYANIELLNAKTGQAHTDAAGSLASHHLNNMDEIHHQPEPKAAA